MKRIHSKKAYWWGALHLTGVLLLLSLSGCGEAAVVERGDYPVPAGAEVTERQPGEYGGRFIMASNMEPKTFNFLVPSDAGTRQVTSLLFNGLTKIDPFTGGVLPDLAKSWEVSEDGLSYTFHLREVNWSDGTPFTADDVIMSFEAIFARDPDGEPHPETGLKPFRYPSRYISQYTIAGEPIQFEKVDDHTVVFRTAEVYAPFLNDIGFVEIMPKHVLGEAFADGTLLNQWTTRTAISRPHEIVGTGPFRIRRFQPAERLILEPNPHYWRFDSKGQRLPYLDFMVFSFVKEANAQVVLFATGQTDSAGVPVTDLVWVQDRAERYDFTVHDRGPDTGITFFWFNQHPGRRPDGRPFVAPHKLEWFTNRDFRRAVMHAFDRQGIIDGVYFGRAEKLHSIISPGNVRWYNPDVVKHQYDPSKALELLKANGFVMRGDRLFDADDNPVEFDLLLYDGSQRASAMATTLSENLRAIGIRMGISMADFGSVLRRTGDTFDYEMSFIGWTGGGDPSGGKALYLSSGRYHVWHPSQESPATEWEARIDEVIRQSDREMDVEARVALIGEMQAIFSEELPLIYTVVPNTYFGIKNHWRNVEIPPVGSPLWNIDEIWTPQDED